MAGGPIRITIAGLLDEFRPGRTIYIPGATAELDVLRRALTAEPDRLAGVRLISCLVPGMNGFDYAALHSEARLDTFLLPPALRTSFNDGRTRVLPLAYSGVGRFLAETPIDVAVLRLCPPVDGRCSFGTCADFGPIVAAVARCSIGVLDDAWPAPLASASVRFNDLDAALPLSEPAATAPDFNTSPVLLRIAEFVAALVPDGATIQTGIGAAPEAVWGSLHAHRGLRLRSGMVTDGFLSAFAAGAMVKGGHVAGAAWGSRRLLDRLHESDLVRFADVNETHGARGLLDVDGFVAINSALEVDLSGQANLEWRGSDLVSGVGGAPDFAAAAGASRGGRFILAIPSTAGPRSRIVPRLKTPSVSLSRHAVDTVVTEHGIAELRGLSVRERAAALISIATPEHRNAIISEDR